jgi:FkbM family methyltransferase
MHNHTTLHDTLRGFVPKPMRRIAWHLLAPNRFVASIPRSLRERKLAQAKRNGTTFVARIPLTHCLMSLEPSHFITQSWFVEGTFEPNVVAVMRRLVRPGMTCIDLGANAGYFTLFLAKLVGQGGTVHAFEPTRATYSLLRYNLTLNRVVNVVAEELAVGDHCGEILFHEGPPGYDVYNTTGELVFTRGATAAQFVTRNVVITTLDKYCQVRSIRKIDFLKLDIEGGEFAALRGAEQVIANSPHLSMVIEVAPELAAASGYRVGDMLAWLVVRGFKLYLIQGSGRLGAITDVERVGGMVAAVRQDD